MILIDAFTSFFAVQIYDLSYIHLQSQFLLLIKSSVTNCTDAADIVWLISLYNKNTLLLKISPY